MKSMLALVLAFGGATVAAGQDLSKPLPGVIQSALPVGSPAPAMISHPTNWNNCNAPQASCTAPQALCPASASGCWATRGTACERLRNWLTFRVCDPNHAPLVPFPYHAPLRAYFPVTPMPVGFNGPLECNSSRRRLCGWEPMTRGPSECSTATGVTARPAIQLLSSPATPSCESPCGTMQRPFLFRRMMSYFSFGGCGILHRCSYTRSPMMCQNNCAGSCAATGQFDYHYAGNQSPMMYPGVPAMAPSTSATVSATRPFTNP